MCFGLFEGQRYENAIVHANFFCYFWQKTKETLTFATIFRKTTINHTYKTMQISGKIINVLPERGGVSQRTGQEWKLAQYVLETFEQYPKKVCFEVFGTDRIQQFGIQAGQDLTIDIDIDAHEYQGRWFNTIRAFRCAPYNPAAALGAPAAPADFPPAQAPIPAAGADFPPAQAPLPGAAPAAAAAPADPLAGGESTDDLPF